MSPEAGSSNSAGVDHRIPAASPLTDAFKKVFEKAVDRARNELVSSGKIGLAVFFVYANGTMNVGVLSFKDELHEGLLKRKVREKALAENAYAVILLTEGERPGTIILSGTAPGLTTVKELLGHKTLTMTLRYAHLAPSHKVKAVDVLDKHMHNPVPTAQKLHNLENI